MGEVNVSILRPDDLVVLTLRFRDVTLVKPNGPTGKAVVTCGNEPLVAVEFPTQSIFEESLDEAEPAPLLGSVDATFGGPSRLVFQLEPGDRFDYTLAAILNRCRRATLRVEPPPDPQLAKDPFPNRPTDSLLEVPARMLLQPSPSAKFDHAPISPTATAEPPRVELWQTRLEGDGSTRVVWTETSEFAALDVDHRRALIDNTSTVPAVFDQLMLTALGAWFEIRGDWEDASTVSSWRHRATMGRDHFIRIVEPGFLFPYGHRAARVTVTERKMPTSAALLRRRQFLVVREPERRFDQHRAVPFRTVQLTTLTTPNLMEEDEAAVIPGVTGASWVRVKDTGEFFEFQMLVTDRRATPLMTSRPMVFVRKDRLADPKLLAWMTGVGKDEFHSPDLVSRRARSMGRRRVAFVEGSGAGADSTFETEHLEIGAMTGVQQDPPFLPKLLSASAHIPVIRELTGSDTGEPVRFAYDDTFLATGSAPLDVFARLVGGGAQPMAFSSPEQAGALVSPNVSVTALSTTAGPVGGTDEDLTQGAFSPASYFDGALDKLKILGGPTLAEVLLAGPVGQNGVAIPKMLSTETPDAISTTLRWQTRLTEKGFFKGSDGVLTLDVTRVKPRQGGAPTSSVTGRIEGVSISMPPGHPLIDIPFTFLEFKAEAGRKIDVGVRVGQLEFRNELRFINALTRIIPLDGFDDPPAVEVNTEGVTVGYSLAVPTVGLGAFSLQNLALGAGFHLPFLGSASMVFAVSARENPFIVTYSAVGGGGFVSLAAGLDGSVAVEAAVEFGGSIAINLGVAAGAVSLMAGIYYGQKPEGTQLAGFVRCVGKLEVLGIVSISVEFYLELLPDLADPVNPAVQGTASLTVKVKVCFFSKKVTLSVTRRFDKGGDPPFAQAVSQSDWSRYCDAFGED